MRTGNNIKGEEEFNSDSKFSNKDFAKISHRELHGKELHGSNISYFLTKYKCELCKQFFFTFSPGVEWKEVDGEEVLHCPKGHPMVKSGLEIIKS